MEYRVTKCRISQIVSMVRKKPDVLAELIDKDAERATIDETLAIFVDNKLINGEVI